MDSLYNTYLKMLTTPFDDPSSDLPDISPEDYPALFALADRHCTLPFVLPYFRNTGLYPQILQKSKHMMLNYYQIDQFTRRTVSLLEKHGITCFVMKGISLAASYPVPEYRKLGDLDLYINIKMRFTVQNRFCMKTAIWMKKNFLIITPLIAIRLKRQDAAFFWSCITVWLEYISINLRTS